MANYVLPVDASFFDDIDLAMEALVASGSFKDCKNYDDILDCFRFVFIMTKLGATASAALGAWAKFNKPEPTDNSLKITVQS